MGAIYRAFDLTLNIDVAVKENFYSGDEHSRQFRREATILASLRHPNLPRVTDHFSISDQGQYLVMDYIQGEDLRKLTNRLGPMSEADVVRVGCAISDALDYLHHRQPPVVHRDIKPGNIKFSPNGEVFLVDFGLAKISQEGQNTTSGAQALTPGYAPPEQYGQGTEPRSDIYSLGATLYAVLTGKVPEDGLARAMGTADLTPVRVHQPTVSAQTAAAIERSMAVIPKERFQSGREFREALCGQPGPVVAEAAEPMPATPPPLPTPTRSSKPGRPALVGGLTLLVAAALVVAFFLILPTLTRPAAVLPATITLPAAAPSTTATAESLPTATAAAVVITTPGSSPTPSPGITDLPTFTATPAGTPLGGGGEIAFASDRSGIPQIWAMQPDGSAVRQVTQLPDGACQPAWGPQQHQIVFISPCRAKANSYPGASLYLINADGAGLVLLPTLPGGDFEPAWSPDGQSIAFTSLRDSRPNIYLIRLADNSVTRLSSPVNYERHPAWSADGASIAYETTRAGFPQIWLMQSDGKNAHEFSTQAGGRSAFPVWAPDGSILVYTQGGSPTFLVGRKLDDPQAVESRITDQLSGVSKPAFSADSWWIAVSVSVDGNDEIYALLRNGSQLTRLTRNPSADFDPAW